MFVFMASCASLKDIVYLQDVTNSEQAIKQNYELKIQKDDLLGIAISCETPELLIPFTHGSVASPASTGSNATPVEQPGTIMNSYLVDARGEIKLPILGTIQAEGYTHSELEYTISNLLRDSGYINNATVNVDLQNFKISFLGELNNVGTINVTSDRITILEALSSAGDLDITGIRKDIIVIRENNGKRTITKVDLTKKSILESPVYYLQPNDVIYIEPNTRRKRESNNTTNIFRTSASIASSVLSVVAIILSVR